MEQYVIKGGNPLVGEVEIAGAKNAALAILAAAIMTDETILIENLPDVRDINVLLEAIAGIGAQVDRIDKSTVKINGSTIGDVSVDYEYIKKIRASYYLIGIMMQFFLTVGVRFSYRFVLLERNRSSIKSPPIISVLPGICRSSACCRRKYAANSCNDAF